VPSPSPSVSPSAPPIASSAPSAGEGGVYLALGDSLTFGIGVPQPRRNGFPARLAERLVTADPPITETSVFAVPGETATGFLEHRLDDVLVAIDELGDRVQLVTIGLGANELLRMRRDSSCEADRAGEACASAVSAATAEAARSLDAVVASVQEALAARGSGARVVVLAYYNPDVDPITDTTLVGADGAVACDPSDGAPGLNDRIACIAEARAVELVDLYAAFLGREAELTRVGGGDIHPNQAGHDLIADVIAAHLGLSADATP